jgi:uncharacterized membrane protein
MAQSKRIGNRLAPPHFIAFAIAMIASVLAATRILPDFDLALMAGFNVAAVLFLFWVSRLLATRDAAVMRAHARDNDANRTFLLLITFMVMVVLFIAIAAEAVGKDPQPLTKVLIIITLIVSWMFSNVVYALHYAHLAYGDDTNGVRGLRFEGTDEPVYEDFLYFAFTIGMTFQTSDVAITDRHIRRIVTLHSIAAFVFNLGVLAFTINVLGDGS